MIKIDIKEYDYDLPVERIAQHPLNERDSSRILLYRNNLISEDVFKNIQHYLPEGSLLVFNNTRVIRARLNFSKESGAHIEILCLEPANPADYSLNFSCLSSVEWKCLVGNSKKWKSGKIELRFKRDHLSCSLYAERINIDGDVSTVRFSWDPADLCFSEVVESAGHMPLPPYITRPDIPEDTERYQTVYSLIKGSVAAPTAGLHFTREVITDLLRNKNEIIQVTLHVGAGTFQPVKSHNIAEHRMHSEHFSVSASSLESLLKYSDKVIAVGTTSVRTLESLYWLGIKIMDNHSLTPDELFIDQWEAYGAGCNISSSESLEALLSWMKKFNLDTIQAATRIIIVPGYQFRVVNGIVTNFHQPKSTLLLLISAWVGEDWKKIYNYAIEHQFRFLSYGDSSLLLRE
jgi:S-adenosylmethionine:tRNA ribosyltransferase-isomerase